jgi:MinD superfamily P-loop ATPase
MKQLVVVSGKGGTGKTSILGAFGVLARNKVLVDCDVDAANLGLLFSGRVKDRHDFMGGREAYIDPARCRRCGRCEKVCRFEAISDFHVDPVECEGCGLCARICPVNAVDLRVTRVGQWFVSDTAHGPLVHARLDPGEENSGKLVSVVREQGQDLAAEAGYSLILIDGSPGIGCPVIASLSGVNLALVVTEPTVSGISDMERILQVCTHFGVPAVVCVNKADLNPEKTAAITRSCQQHGYELVGTIPFDPVFIHAQVAGQTIMEYTDGGPARTVKTIWERVARRLE